MADKSLRDLRLGADGDWDSAGSTAPASVAVSGVDAIRQHLQIRLRSIKGECQWDLDQGVDYLGIVFRKGATDGEIATEVQRVILDTPGISGLRQFSLQRDSVTRQLAVQFVATADEGLIEALVPLLEEV